MIHNCTETLLTKNRKWEGFHHDEAKTSWAELAGSLSTSERECVWEDTPSQMGLGKTHKPQCIMKNQQKCSLTRVSFWFFFSSLQKYFQLPALLVILWFCFINSFSHFFLFISINSVLGIASTLDTSVASIFSPFSLNIVYDIYGSALF